MTRSRSTSPLVGRWVLLLLLALGSGRAGRAQPGSEAAQQAAVDSTSTTVAKPASNWPWMLGLLVGGIALGVLGARMWARKAAAPEAATATAVAIEPILVPQPEPAPLPKKPAENVVRTPVVQSLRQVQGTPPASGASSDSSPKQSGKGKKHKPNFNSRSTYSSDQPSSWPAIPPRPAAMNPTPPKTDDQPLETGQTIEWSAPTSTPPAIQELIDSTATDIEVPIDRDARAQSMQALEAAVAPVASNGPVHYYAPAPDVPSIEHRKLSPNPLPQMPLLITLPHAEAVTAQFSFSPQADQSRIIGNGVRELKEFFQFELPPTEQFTTIKNLAPGKLEKREDTWHVVQKAGIALS
ncbi:MAG: hypothetical protein JWR44_2207 [Hymenobacter sp.]|jgi:hypothetical protein|nr:hypothetical protein [Hymenobacter sp.]